jgi:hypothetical protein
MPVMSFRFPALVPIRFLPSFVSSISITTPNTTFSFPASAPHQNPGATEVEIKLCGVYVLHMGAVGFFFGK